MKTLLVIAVVLFASAIAEDQEGKDFIDYRLVSNSNPSVYFFKSLIEPREITCTAQGKICDQDCKKIWTCIKTNNEEYKPALLETCNATQTCNNGTCSNTPSPECALGPDHDFVCQAEGVFPDPRTCKKYHYCIKKDSGGGGGSGRGPLDDYDDDYEESQFATYADDFDDHERTCNYNRGYNTRTTYCDKILINDQCGADYPVPICKAPGQHAALKDNPSIFYVCSLYNNEGTILYPYLYLCKDGWVYDGNYGCKAK